MAKQCGTLKRKIYNLVKSISDSKVKMKEVLFSGKSRKKPMMFDVHKVTDSMIHNLILAPKGIINDTLEELKGEVGGKGIITNPETYKKIHNALQRSGKKNVVLKDLDTNVTDPAEVEALGQVIRFRSIALSEIISSIESEKNIEGTLGITEPGILETLKNADGSRKLNKASISKTVGKALAENMGFKISADPVVANYQYQKIGDIALESLESSGIITMAENDIILNNKFKDENMNDVGRNKAKTLTGYPTVSLVADAMLDEKDKGNQEKRDSLMLGLETSAEGRISSSETAKETIAGIAGVRRLTIPSNMQGPITNKKDVNSSENQPVIKDLGKPGSTDNITEANKELLKALQGETQQVNPKIGKMVLHMKEILEKLNKNTIITPEATLNNFYEAMGFNDPKIRNAVFGSMSDVTPDDMQSKVGQAISRENPFLQFIMNADQYFNEDGTAVDFNHQLGLYRTTRLEYLATFLNEQMDKGFARAMVQGDPVEIEVDTAIGEQAYNDVLHSLLDDTKSGNLNGESIDVAHIIGETVDPALDLLVKTYKKDYIDNDNVKEQLSFMAALGEGKIGDHDFDLGGSAWQQLATIEAIYDIQTMNEGGSKTLKTAYRTKPDAAASGVMLSFMQNLGKDSDGDLNAEDEVYDIMRRMGYSKDDVAGDDALKDAYDILIKQVEAAASRDKGRDGKTKELMDKLTKLGLFKAMRDIAKPMTMTTNYQAGRETAVKSTSAELRETVTKKLHSGIKGDALAFVKEMIKGDTESSKKFYEVNGIDKMSAKQIANVEGINVQIERFFSENLSEKLRDYIDEGINPAMKDYKSRINSNFKHMEEVYKEDLLDTDKGPGEKVGLPVIPAMAWTTMTEAERAYPGEPGSDEYIAHHKALLDKYGMPLTSRTQVLNKTGDGSDVITTAENPNALTASVNTIHGVDSAIFFKSHIDTRAEIEAILKSGKYKGNKLTDVERKGFETALKNASGMIHDANNTDPYYNMIYTPHYRRNSVDISSDYDVEEQMALTYMSYKGVNGAYSQKVADAMWKSSQKLKAKKQEALKSIDKESHRFFGYPQGKPESKIEEEVDTTPEETFIPEDFSTEGGSPETESEYKNRVKYYQSAMEEYRLNGGSPPTKPIRGKNNPDPYLGEFGFAPFNANDGSTANKEFDDLMVDSAREVEKGKARVKDGETPAARQKRLDEHEANIDKAIPYWTKNSKIIREFFNDLKKKTGAEAKDSLLKGNQFSYLSKYNRITVPNLDNLASPIAIYAMEHEIAHMKSAGYMSANPDNKHVKIIDNAVKNIDKYKDPLMKAVGDNEFIKQRLDYAFSGNPNQLRAELVAVLGSETEVAKRFVAEMDKINQKSFAQKMVLAAKYIFKTSKEMSPEDLNIDAKELLDAVQNVINTGQEFNTKDNDIAKQGRHKYIVDRALEEGKINEDGYVFDADGKPTERNIYDEPLYLGKKKDPKSPREKGRKVLEDATGYTENEAFKIKPEESEGYIPGMRQWNTLNNYTGATTRNFMDDRLEPFLGKSIDEADTYLSKNFPVYKKTRNIVTDYWNSADWLQSQKGYLDRARSGDLFALNKLETIQMNAEQEAKRVQDEMISRMNKILGEAKIDGSPITESNIADINRVAAYTPLFHLMNQHGDYSRILKAKDPSAEIDKMIAEIGDVVGIKNVKKARKLGMVLAKKDSLDTSGTSYYNIEQMNITDGNRQNMERLTALYAMKNVDGSKNGIEVLKQNPELATEISLMSLSLKEVTESIFNGLTGKKDKINFRENLMYEQFEDQVEFKAVDERMLKSKEFASSKGWKVIRKPGKNSYGVVYRDRSKVTSQSGAGTTVDFSHYDIMVDSSIQKDGNKTMEGVTNVQNGTNNPFHKVVLTQAELDQVPGLLTNPADSLVRAYSQALLAKNTQAARDYLVVGDKIDTQNIKGARSFDKSVNDLKATDRPWMIKIPSTMTLEEYERQFPETMLHYKVPENVSRIGGFNEEFDLVRKDMNDMIMGYKDPEFFEDNSTLRDWSYVMRQAVIMIKTHWVIVNPQKIAADAVSNNVILAAYGLPPIPALKYQRDGFKYGNEMSHLRSGLVDLEFEIHGYGDLKENAAKKKKAIAKRDALAKKIQNHLFAPMYQNGMVQSMSTEVLVKDASVVSGLQKDIEKLFNTFLKDDKDMETGINTAVREFSKAGFDGEKILEFAGKNLKNFEMLGEFGKKMGEAIKESGERIGAKKQSGDMAKYLSEFIASPDSEAVRLGSYLVQMTDISSRYALYKHLMNTRGSNNNASDTRGNPITEEEVVVKVLEAFVDYKVNMPKELKVMSDYGVILFPSFWLRIQKVIYALAKDNLLKVGAGITLSEMLSLPIESYYDSNIFAKAGNIINQPPVFTDPLDIILPTDLIAEAVPFL